ncbi:MULTISPECIES: helix-turn-helix transcriptional regulator [unclassified Sphingomonas]|uniref:helix-turn-helix transcriptional regulator n=1 Tax=unclassified Sphingomonas TaxID=196159 RepID=UPI000A9DDFC1|nr:MULTISPECIES: helix-turn-helix transcriptional regulator [unclassified Sphingomonas]
MADGTWAGVAIFERTRMDVPGGDALDDRGSSAWQGRVEAMVEPAALLGEAGEVVVAAGAFVAIAGGSDGVTLSGALPRAMLRTVAPGDQGWLDAAIARVVTGGADTAAVRCCRPVGRTPLIVVIRRIEARERTARAAAIVTLIDPARRPAPAPSLWREAFALTPSEAALAALLTSGHSLESAAAARDCRATTLRVHLRRMFAKTGVSRQSDLIALLARMGPA